MLTEIGWDGGEKGLLERENGEDGGLGLEKRAMG